MTIKSYIILLFACGCLLPAFGQADRVKPGKYLERRMLNGRWRSDKDKKNVLSFTAGRNYYIEYYDKEIVDSIYFSFSRSCTVGDSATHVDLYNAFLIVYTADSTFFRCNDILTLDKRTLSYQDKETGQLQVFNKIIQRKKSVRRASAGSLIF